MSLNPTMKVSHLLLGGAALILIAPWLSAQGTKIEERYEWAQQCSADTYLYVDDNSRDHWCIEKGRHPVWLQGWTVHTCLDGYHTDYAGDQDCHKDR